jgi:hypothetical protein
MKRFLQIKRGKRLPWATCILPVVWAALSFPLYAQVPQQRDWDKTFGGSGGDGLSTIVVAPDGGYLLAGSSNSGISGDKTQPSRGATDYWIVRIDASGNKQWDKTYGGNNSDELNAAVGTPDGGFLLAGSSNSGISGDKTQAGSGTWLVKIHANGSKHWDKLVSQKMFTTVLPASGGYALADYDESAGGFLLMKIDLNGNTLWEKSYGSGGAGSSGRVIATATADGGFLLASITDGDTGVGVRLVKTDAAGNKQWEKTIAAYYHFIYALIQDNNSGYLIGGYFHGPNDEAQWRAVKVSATGSKQWEKEYGSESDDYFAAGIASPAGGYVLGGYSRGGTGGDKTEPYAGYWLLGIDANGNRVWGKTFNGEYDSYLTSIVSTPDGNYLVGGNSNSGIGRDKTEPSRNGYDFWIVKTKPLTAQAPAVTQLTLINADTDQDISILRNGAIIDYADLGTKNISVRANTAPANVGSVVFTLNGRVVRTENIVPYALGGDNMGNPPDYYAYSLPTGTHTLTATPYTNTYGRGTAGTAFTVRFTVVNGPTVLSFTLINADTDQDVRELKNGDVIDYSKLGTRNINIRANTYPGAVGSVVFRLNSQVITENLVPYALGGDVYPSFPVNYRAITIPVGTHTLRATPYSARAGSGTAGNALSIAFRVTTGAATRLGEEIAGGPLSVSPNPFTDKLHLQTAETGELKVEVVDNLGRIHYQGIHAPQAGQAEVNLPTRLPSGMYLMRVSHQGKSPQVIKVVKQ